MYGSVIVKSDSLAELSGAQSVKFSVGVEAIPPSEKYGSLNGILHNGGTMAVSTSGIVPSIKTTGFTFKLNRTTGIFQGKTKMSFSGKDKVSASFSGVIMPHWFSDCECQEDDDKVVPMTFLPFGVGQFFYNDSVNGRRSKRSVPVSLGAATTE